MTRRMINSGTIRTEIDRLETQCSTAAQVCEGLRAFLDSYDNEDHVGTVLATLRELGYKPHWNPDIKSVSFYYFGNKVTYYTKKQYFNGKGLEPGFGFDNLVDQLKRKPIPRPKSE